MNHIIYGWNFVLSAKIMYVFLTTFWKIAIIFLNNVKTSYLNGNAFLFLWNKN
jgi:hypothetical protein